jgi:hypothetical protein
MEFGDDGVGGSTREVEKQKLAAADLMERISLLNLYGYGQVGGF